MKLVTNFVQDAVNKARGQGTAYEPGAQEDDDEVGLDNSEV